MTVKIYKYHLSLEEFPAVRMPERARILHFNNQNESLVIWAEVDVNAPEITRHFQVVGTGKAVPTSQTLCGASYIGSALFQDGLLVWHLYEIL